MLTDHIRNLFLIRKFNTSEVRTMHTYFFGVTSHENSAHVKGICICKKNTGMYLDSKNCTGPVKGKFRWRSPALKQ